MLLRVIIIYILIIIISIIIGLNIRLNHKELNSCQGGICPPPKKVEMKVNERR